MAEKTISNDLYKLTPTPLQVGDKKLQLTYDPDNGETKLYEIITVGGVQTAKGEIYKNGVWNITGMNAVSNQDERIKIHDQVKTAITKARSTSGGVDPAFVKNNIGSLDTQIGGGTTPTGPQGIAPIIGNILGAITNPVGALSDFDVSGNLFDDPNEKRLFGDSKLLTYPINLLTEQQDRIEISQYRYQPTGAKQLFNDPGKIIRENLQRGSALSKLIGMAILPIPNNISDSNNVSWGKDQMDALTAGATGLAMNNMKTYLGGGVGAGSIAAIIELLSKGQSPVGALQAAKGGAAGLLYADLLSNAAQSKAATGSLASSFASQVLKLAQFEVPPESILARGFGIIPNSNLELLFNSPELRSFQFAYRLSPRSAEEARNVKRIIRFFKQGMSPRKQTGDAGQSSAGQNSYFLGTPNVFKLSYKTGKNNSISGLNKFKTCALRSFNVNYSPDGNWAAYDEGQPVSVTITMEFGELEPIYNTDYQTSIFKDKDVNRDDLYPVQDDDVGY